jgi:hypothetical protein
MIGVAIFTLVVAIGVVTVIRRRRAVKRSLNLGVVSQQWLVLHRAEDQ